MVQDNSPHPTRSAAGGAGVSLSVFDTPRLRRRLILIGASALLLLSARRWLYVMMVPLYYLLVQSTMHTDFRYTLLMHYFVFIKVK